jgi:hypothetical protein
MAAGEGLDRFSWYKSSGLKNCVTAIEAGLFVVMDLRFFCLFCASVEHFFTINLNLGFLGVLPEGIML